MFPALYSEKTNIYEADGAVKNKGSKNQ